MLRLQNQFMEDNLDHASVITRIDTLGGRQLISILPNHSKTERAMVGIDENMQAQSKKRKRLEEAVHSREQQQLALLQLLNERDGQIQGLHSRIMEQQDEVRAAQERARAVGRVLEAQQLKQKEITLLARKLEAAEGAQQQAMEDLGVAHKEEVQTLQASLQAAQANLGATDELRHRAAQAYEAFFSLVLKVLPDGRIMTQNNVELDDATLADLWKVLKRPGRDHLPTGGARAWFGEQAVNGVFRLTADATRWYAEKDAVERRVRAKAIVMGVDKTNAGHATKLWEYLMRQ